MKEKQICSNIIVKLINQIDNESKEYLFTIEKENDLPINNAIKDFFKLNNITIIPPYYLYLKRNNIIKKELDKSEIITKINLKTNDEIIISSNKLIINLYEETIDSDNYINEKNYVQTTYETMMAGVMAVKPGATTGDLGAAMQSVAESEGYSVVRDYCGHGCGGVFHGAPNILNFGRKGAGVKLVKGMVFTVEPMVNVGTFETMTLKDDWTVVTKDKQLSAQFEHMVAVTDSGVEILTESPKGWKYPPYQEK